MKEDRADADFCSQQARWRNFRANKRAYWSLIIFSICFFISLLAELIANDKPILVKYRGEYFFPIANFYPETAFGGDFKTEAVYRDPEVQCLIMSGGLEDCFESPEAVSYTHLTLPTICSV